MAERTVAEIMEALARIETSVDTIAKNGADHETRLRALETRGSKRFDALSLTLLSTLLVGVLGYFLGKLF